MKITNNLKISFFFISAILLLAMACTKTPKEGEEPEPEIIIEAGDKLAVPAQIPSILTKTGWEQDGTNLSFNWNSLSGMICTAIGKDGKFYKWGGKLGRDYYSKMSVKGNSKEASLLSTFSVAPEDFEEGEVFCYAPRDEKEEDGYIYSSSKDTLILALTMPYIFNVKEGNINELTDYSYIYAKTNIRKDKSKGVITEKATFNLVPIIVRLNAKNINPDSDKAIELDSLIFGLEDSKTKEVVGCPSALIIEKTTNDIKIYEGSKYHYNDISMQIEQSVLKSGETKSYYMLILPRDDKSVYDNLNFIIRAKDKDGEVLAIENIKGKKSINENGSYINVDFDIKKNPIVQDELPDGIAELDPKPEMTSLSFKKRVLSVLFTGTDCQYCPKAVHMINYINSTPFKDTIIFVEAHVSGSLINQKTSTFWRTFYEQGGGTPRVNLNLRKRVRNSPSWYGEEKSNYEPFKKEVREVLFETLEKAKDNVKVHVGIGARIGFKNNKLVVEALVKSAKTKQDYRLGIWIVESGINAPQTGGEPGDEIHNNVIRDFYNRDRSTWADFLGEPLGSISKGIKKYHKVEIDNISSKVTDPSKCKILIFVSSVVDNYYHSSTNAIICDLKDGVEIPIEYE